MSEATSKPESRQVSPPPTPFYQSDGKYAKFKVPTPRTIINRHGMKVLAAGLVAGAYWMGHNRVLSTVADRVGKFGKNTYNKIMSAVNSYKQAFRQNNGNQNQTQTPTSTPTPDPTPVHDKTA